MLSEVARNYILGRPPLNEADLSDRLAAPQAQIDIAIEKLLAGRLLLRAAEPPGISLARAPETVSAAEIFQTLRGELSAPVTDDPFLGLLRRRDLEVQRGLNGVTLKSLSEAIDDQNSSEPCDTPEKL